MEIIVGAAIEFLACASTIYFLQWLVKPLEPWCDIDDDFPE